jgi:hypothetical protein
MKKRVTVKGSSWQDAAEDAAISCGLPNRGGLLNDVTGFRLALEPAFEAYRGTMHNREPDVASGPDRCLVSPLRSHRNLSFRLTRGEAE